MSSKLAIKIFLRTFIVLNLTFGVFFITLNQVLPQLYEQEYLNQFDESLRELILELEHAPLDRMMGLISQFSIENNADISIFNEYHELLYQFIHTNIAGVIDGYLLGSEAQHLVSEPEYLEELGVGFFNYPTEQALYLAVGVSLTTVDQVATTLQKILPYFFGFSLLLSVFIAIVYAHYLAKPIVSISRVSQKMKQMNLSSRCDIKRVDEIGDLANNLNDMAEKLAQAITTLEITNEQLQLEMERERKQEKQRSHLFAALSHELKTPLTILQGELEGMIDQIGIYQDRDKYLQHAYQTTESMEKLVHDILTISRMEMKDIKLNIQEINMSELVLDVLQRYELLAQNKNMTITYDYEDDLIVLADEEQLKSGISNIVSNAIFHSPIGEHIVIQLITQGEIGVLTVENFGIHLREPDLENIFTPFHRTDQSRSRYSGGSGLGLFIVKNIFDLHQFSYEIGNSEKGVIFTVQFPLVQMG